MLNLILMILLNLVVGGCIGLTGIAGFLLPMFYTGFLCRHPRPWHSALRRF